MKWPGIDQRNLEAAMHAYTNLDRRLDAEILHPRVFMESDHLTSRVTRGRRWLEWGLAFGHRMTSEEPIILERVFMDLGFGPGARIKENPTPLIAFSYDVRMDVRKRGWNVQVKGAPLSGFAVGWELEQFEIDKLSSGKIDEGHVYDYASGMRKYMLSLDKRGRRIEGV